MREKKKPPRPLAVVECGALSGHHAAEDPTPTQHQPAGISGRANTRVPRRRLLWLLASPRTCGTSESRAGVRRPVGSAPMSMSMSSAASSSGASIHATTHFLRKLQEERADVLTPSAYDPRQPQPSPFPLKSFPALALANEPPTVPLAAPASPVVAASARGFSRSAAGLPWANSASSVSSPQPSKAGWSPFTTESASRFRPHTDGRERLLNHQRLVLEGQPQVFSLPTVEHVAPPSRRAFANAFQSSPRGVALEGSFRDSVSKSWSL